MATRRDSSGDYARRNQLAQDAGWKNYYQYRKARRELDRSSIDVQAKYGRFLVNKGRNLSRQEEKSAFRSFWQGLIDPTTRDDTSKESPKAEWFVYWLDLPDFHDENGDPDFEIWDEMYGEDE